MQDNLIFKKNTPGSFYPVLKSRVKAYIDTTDAPDSYSMKKCFALGCIFILLYAGLYLTETPANLLLCYAVLGFATTVIMLNIVHEAAHNALFSNKKWNNAVLLWMDFMGSDGRMFKRRHAHHHACSNVPGHDIDISNSPLIRVLPNAPYHPLHRLQRYYAVFFYLLYTLYWFFVRDILDITSESNVLKLSFMQRMLVVFKKISAIFFFIVFPCFISELSAGFFITGFVLMHFTMSLLALVTITSSHVNDETEFPVPDENGNMPYTWGEHQLRVTHDFGAGNKLFTLIMGGFNYHVAHHLFPSVSSRHFPAITKIIRSTAEEFNVPYSNSNLWMGIRAHFRLIFNNSNPPEMDF